MVHRRVIAALGLVVGCAEHPSLRVEVTHPADATSAIAETTITVYESPIVSCAKVELGDLTEAELTAIEVDRLAIGDGSSLEMSREGTKVIVARGLDASGSLIAAGCAEQGTIGEDDVLAISTELAARVSISGIGLDEEDPFGIAVTVTDPFVRSLPDRTVAWRVHGSDGAVPLETAGLSITGSEWVPERPACTDDNGLVRIHPVPPSTIGGFATAVRTAWSVEPPRVFTTFTPFDPSGAVNATPVSDGATTLSQRRCALRIAGTTRSLVCLEDRAGTPTAVDYKVTVAAGVATLTPQGTQTFSGLLGGEVPLNVFAIDRGTARDVYALTTRARLVGLFSPSLGADPGPRLLAASATDVAVLPACGTTPPALLVLVEAANGKELRTLAVAPSGLLGAGEALEPYLAPPVGLTEGLGINATGCLAELRADSDPIVHQVGVVDITNRSGPGNRNLTTAFFRCGGSTCTIQMAVPRAGVGFLPADATHPERLVGATFDASGTLLSAVVLQPDNTGRPRPVEQERITSAAFPQHVVTGNFDADGLPDLFWDIGNPNTATTNFQISYALPVLGQRLSALSGTQPDAVVVETFVGDVDGDGNDDLVVTLQDRPLTPTKHRVFVLPGQVAIPPTTLRQDAACAR